MMRKNLLGIGAMFALGVNYAAAWIVAFIWNWPNPDSELTVHVLLMLLVSMLFGALIIDMKRALFFSVGSIIMGFVLATVIIAMPALIVEGPGGIEASVTVAVSTIAKLFVVSVTFLIIGVFAGCIVGDAVTGIEPD